jgi:sugar phosphate isomerase/epimerase
MKLGVALEATGLPLRAGLAKAAKLGVAGIQFDAVGELAPPRLSATGRRELVHLLRSHNLSLAAIVCPLRRGLDESTDLEQRLDRLRQAMSLSFDLGARLVAIDAGRIPSESDDPRRLTMQESLSALGRHGDHIGAMLALRTGAESGESLAKLFNRIDSGAVGVNYDPACWLSNDFDPLHELSAVSRRVVHVYAKDARRVSALQRSAAVPLGHGDLDWMQIVATLSAMEYRGWIVVERTGDRKSELEVAASVSFLRRLGA